MDDVTVPEGDAARAAWHSLDADTRKAALWAARRLVPYPDPAVAAIAYGYARAEMDGRSFPGRRGTRYIAAALASWAVLLGVLAAAVPEPPGGRAGLAALLSVLVVLLVADVALLIAYTRRLTASRRYRSLALVLVANRAAVVPPPAPLREGADERRSDAAAPVVVRYDRMPALRRTTSASAVFLVAAALAAAALVVLAAAPPVVRALLGVFAVVVSLLAAVSVVQAALWARHLVTRVIPRRPALVIGPAGVEFPEIDRVLPWAELVELGIHDHRTARYGRRPERILAFVSKNPLTDLAGLTGRRRRRGIRALQLYGTPLTVGDGWLDRTSDQIVTDMTTFAEVTVRRH